MQSIKIVSCKIVLYILVDFEVQNYCNHWKPFKRFAKISFVSQRLLQVYLQPSIYFGQYTSTVEKCIPCFSLVLKQKNTAIVTMVTSVAKKLVNNKTMITCGHYGIKRQSLQTSLVAHQAGAYPGFRSMKRLVVFLLPPEWDASPSQGYPQQ